MSWNQAAREEKLFGLMIPPYWLEMDLLDLKRVTILLWIVKDKRYSLLRIKKSSFPNMKNLSLIINLNFWDSLLLIVASQSLPIYTKCFLIREFYLRKNLSLLIMTNTRRWLIRTWKNRKKLKTILTTFHSRIYWIPKNSLSMKLGNKYKNWEKI